MPKSKQQKQETVGALTQGLKTAKGVVFANFQGLTVAESEDLRHQCRAEKVVFTAAKKTLVQRALEEAGISSVNPRLFKGGVATFISEDEEVTAAKIVHKFAKTHELVTIFGGLLEGAFIDASAVKNLAALPSKHELLSKMVGTLNAPVAGFVNVLAGNLRNFVGVLSNIQRSTA